MVKMLQLLSATTGFAAGDDSTALLQTFSHDQSVGNRILAAVANGSGDTICVEAAVGDIAPVPGSFTATTGQRAVEVAAGTVAEENGAFCVAKATVLLLQRTHSLHSANDIESALTTKDTTTATPTMTTSTSAAVVPPNAQNFGAFDFAGDTQKKVMVKQCPDKSGTRLTQTMEATVSKKGNPPTTSEADQMRVCACRDFLKDGVALTYPYRLSMLGDLAYQFEPRVQLGAYPGYSGDLRITGEVKARKVLGKVFVDYDLKGVEDACKTTPDGIRYACGIHIHEGRTCNDHGKVGHEYWESSQTDPWWSARYTTQNGSVANGRVSADIGRKRHSGIAGRALVVRDSTGARVACALLPTSAIPDFRAECKQADTFEKRTSMAKMINDPTQVVSYTATYQGARGAPNFTANLTGWEHCSKAWIVEGACAEMVHSS